jgi:hypothetical protein
LLLSLAPGMVRWCEGKMACFGAHLSHETFNENVWVTGMSFEILMLSSTIRRTSAFVRGC